MMPISMIHNKDRLILRCEVLQVLQITLKANTPTYVHSGRDTVQEMCALPSAVRAFKVFLIYLIFFTMTHKK